MFVGLVWLTINLMFGSGNFWDKSSSWFLKILRFLSFESGNFRIFKNAFGQFIQNCPLKHVITSTNMGGQRPKIGGNWQMSSPYFQLCKTGNINSWLFISLYLYFNHMKLINTFFLIEGISRNKQTNNK